MDSSVAVTSGIPRIPSSHKLKVNTQGDHRSGGAVSKGKNYSVINSTIDESGENSSNDDVHVFTEQTTSRAITDPGRPRIAESIYANESKFVKKSLLSTTRIMILRAEQEHSIAATCFRGRHNVFIFIPLEILALATTVLGFFVSTQGPDKDPTGAKGYNIGISIGVLGSVAVSLQAIAKHINLDGRASMHESCAVNMRRILQDIRNTEFADPNSPGLFDKQTEKTVIHLTERESRILEKAESDHNTTLESCRSLIPKGISNAFSKMQAEFILMVSPVGSGGSLVDDATSFILLEYCFAELSIVLGDYLKPPSFSLPSADWAVRKAMNNVKRRLRHEAAQDLQQLFPYSENVQRFCEKHADTLQTSDIGLSDRTSWLRKMSLSLHPSPRPRRIAKNVKRSIDESV